MGFSGSLAVFFRPRFSCLSWEAKSTMRQQTLTRLPIAIAVFATSTILYADGPKDNIPENVRPVPRVGIEVSPDDQAELQAGLKTLQAQIKSLQSRRDARTPKLLPDVEIYYRAVHDALAYREFFSPREVGKAKALLVTGQQRAKSLAEGKAPWTEETGLVVRGYRSKLDGTAQPYGLVVPKSYTTSGKSRFRCDIWFHGRGETLSEVNFIDSRTKQVGRLAPRDTIVLHPYGRYSNAFKFAGEVDVLEALQSVQQNYRVDDDRIAVRGFSMGGAACWQFAVHYADRWYAANPGAGFSETPEFLKFFQKETLNPTWYERKLWHMYDCTDYAVNLLHCPTVAYSGELDTQKQAADIMETALAKERIDMLHIIGPGTNHAIHPDSAIEIDRRMQSLAEVGRERTPKVVRFTTYTLKYNRMHWVQLDALGEHWKKARVDAALTLRGGISVRTENVAALTLSFPAGRTPLRLERPVAILIDGATVTGPRPKSDRSWECSLVRDGDIWKVSTSQVEGLRKQHDLQGPIDDALMDSFVFVSPTGKTNNANAQKWSAGELEHARVHWRKQFRGDARIKKDTDITDADIASSNLVLWGDPQSNKLLARIADRLPIKWTDKEIVVGKKRYSTDHHALILIYPNPLNPSRYIVLNSGFTYREFAYLNNARQVPMLPDWAVVDLRTPPGSQYPGKIVDADFFGEEWQLRAPQK